MDYEYVDQIAHCGEKVSAVVLLRHELRKD